MTETPTHTPDPTVALLERADPGQVNDIMAGVLLMTEHKHVMDLEPDDYLKLVDEASADKARDRATIIVAALERHGYLIALRV